MADTARSGSHWFVAFSAQIPIDLEGWLVPPASLESSDGFDFGLHPRSGTVRRASYHPHAVVALSVRRDGGFRFAVVADTHSGPHPATRERLVSLQPDAILHAGDIGELSVLDGLAEVAPVFAVRGNIDTHASHIPEYRVLEVIDGAALKLRILLTHIAVYGAKLRAEVAQRALSEAATLVVCGHSHVPSWAVIAVLASSIRSDRATPIQFADRARLDRPHQRDRSHHAHRLRDRQAMDAPPARRSA